MKRWLADIFLMVGYYYAIKLHVHAIGFLFYVSKMPSIEDLNRNHEEVLSLHNRNIRNKQPSENRSSSSTASAVVERHSRLEGHFD